MPTELAKHQLVDHLIVEVVKGASSTSVSGLKAGHPRPDALMLYYCGCYLDDCLSNV